MKQDFVRFLDTMRQDTIDGRETVTLGQLIQQLHQPLDGTEGPDDVAPLGDLFEGLTNSQKAIILRMCLGDAANFVRHSIIERLVAASEGAIPPQVLVQMPFPCLLQLYTKAVERAETGTPGDEINAPEVDVVGR